MPRPVLFVLQDPKALVRGQWIFVEESGTFAARLQHPRHGAKPMDLRDQRHFGGYEELMAFADSLLSNGWCLTTSPDRQQAKVPPLKPRPTYPPIKAALA